MDRPEMSAETVEATPKAPPKANAARTRASSLLLASFAAVYILWGSTFFAIRIGIESFPPLILAGLRHLSVGLVFYPVFRRVSGEKPTLRQWRTTIVTGVLLLLCGNGTVSWAEKVIPSGIAALLVATVSLWMVLVDSGLAAHAPHRGCWRA
jgi:drug/metabolite transporter (DMT)-like permease